MMSPLYSPLNTLKGTQIARNVFLASFPSDATHITLPIRVASELKELPRMDRMMLENETRSDEPTEVCIYFEDLLTASRIRSVTVKSDQPVKALICTRKLPFTVQAEGAVSLKQRGLKSK